MTRPLLHRVALLAALVAVFACQEVDADLDGASGDLGDELALAPGQFVVSEFTGSFDPETGELSLESVPAGEWRSARVLDAEELRTVPQALWCPQSVGPGDDRVDLATVTGSIGGTLEDCGIPINGYTIPLGALCATVQLTSRLDDTLVRPMAEIVEITPGYEGYRWDETDGVVGVDPSTLDGPNPPSLLQGLFGYPDLEYDESARTTWAFHNPRTGSFSFDGRILAEAYEACNEVDDDCDGEVDEGAGCMVLGEECSSDFDCASGNCGSAGRCSPSLCGDGDLNGSETDIDCGGPCNPCSNDSMCLVGGDCASGNCRAGTCVANRYPNAGEIVITEILVDGGDGLGDQDFEWFEIRNVSSDRLDLEGCSFTDADGGSFAVGALTIPAGGYQVFAHELIPDDVDHDAAWAAHIDAMPTAPRTYSGFTFNNTEDSLSLSCPLAGGPQTIDEMSTGAATDRTTVQLHPGTLTAAANNSAANLCEGTSEYHAGYHGTPGAPNTSCNVEIDACYLIGPGNLTVPEGGSAVYLARVQAAGVTSTTSGTDPAPSRMIGQIGVGPTGTPATTGEDWEWHDVTPDLTWSDAGFPTFDGYIGSFVVDLAQGESRDVAFRWTGNNGGDWVVCQNTAVLNATFATGSPEDPGDLVITELMPDPAGGDSTGEWFEVRNVTGGALDLDGCRISEAVGGGVHTIVGSTVLGSGAFGVLVADALGDNGPGTLILEEYDDIALDAADGLTIECPDGGGGFTVIDSVTYTADMVSSGVAIQVDPSRANATDNDNPGYWCPSASSFDPAPQYGSPGSFNPACFRISWCRTQWPTNLEATYGGKSVTVYGRVNIDRLTDLTGGSDGHPLVVSAVGYGPDNTDPWDEDAGWVWTPAVADPEYGVDSEAYEPENDEYVATFTAPEGSGPWDVAYRFSNGSQTVYCDRDRRDSGGADGSADGYQRANSVPMTAPTVEPIHSCFVRSPKDITAEHAGETVRVYGRLRVVGLTEDVGSQDTPSLVAEHGYGRDGDHPSSWDTWVEAEPNTGGCIACGDYDEYEVDFTVPTAADGPYDHAYRVSGDGGETWTYCDRSLDNTWTLGDEPSLVPNTWHPSYCRIQFPTSISAVAGTIAPTAYGRVFAFEPGGDTDTCTGHDPNSVCLTARSAGVDESDDLVAQFGYGPTTDVESGWTWADAQPNPSWDDTVEPDPNNDEYQVAIDLPDVPGSYYTAYRFSGDGGVLWTYCATSWNWVGDDAGGLNPLGTLNVAVPTPPYELYFDGQDGKGAAGSVDGAVVDVAGAGWTVDVSAADLDLGDYFRVIEVSGNRKMEANDVDAEVVWSSPSIDISGAASVDVRVDVGSFGTFESTDTFEVRYCLDGGACTAFFSETGNVADQTVEALDLSGSTIRVEVAVDNDADSEYYYFDAVRVTE